MRHIAGRYKHYVEVIVDVAADGTCTPLCIVWDDGTSYAIERVLDARPAPSRKVEGKGMRYTVRIRGKDTYLFCEGKRWFVEAKEVTMP